MYTWESACTRVVRVAGAGDSHPLFAAELCAHLTKLALPLVPSAAHPTRRLGRRQAPLAPLWASTQVAHPFFGRPLLLGELVKHAVVRLDCTLHMYAAPAAGAECCRAAPPSAPLLCPSSPPLLDPVLLLRPRLTCIVALPRLRHRLVPCAAACCWPSSFSSLWCCAATGAFCQSWKRCAEGWWGRRSASVQREG
jgi:hypothetical protein